MYLRELNHLPTWNNSKTLPIHPTIRIHLELFMSRGFAAAAGEEREREPSFKGVKSYASDL